LVRPGVGLRKNLRKALMLSVENKAPELSPLSFLDRPGITGTKLNKQLIGKRSEKGL